MKPESPRTQLDALGEYIRSQRKSAELSLRELAEKTGVSNPYLSQLERGLHEPSMRVLSAIADALEVSIETLLRSAGLLRGEDGDDSVELPSTAVAIAADRSLTDDQRTALLAVYNSYVEGNRASGVLDDLDDLDVSAEDLTEVDEGSASEPDAVDQVAEDADDTQDEVEPEPKKPKSKAPEKKSSTKKKPAAKKKAAK